ncbi:hypothetical protein JCM10213_006237 [Rhodosporidiobolus nylandii]
MAEQDTSRTLANHFRNGSLDEPAVRALTASTASTSAQASASSTGEEDTRATGANGDQDVQDLDGRRTNAEDGAVAVAEGEVGGAADALDGADGENGFEAVSLEDGGRTGDGWSSSERPPLPTHPSSPSPAPTSTPPLSPVTTPATSAGGPSSSSITVPSLHAPAVESSKPAEPASPVPPHPTAEPATSPKPDETPKKQLSTKAPTVMQKVMSFTRPRQLPPKPKEEEEKHLRQLAEMRVASREAEKRRKSEHEARAAARAASLVAALPQWESLILPNWRIVLHDDSQGRYLRRLWWDGTMPLRWRGRLWALAIGNGLAVPKSAFATAQKRARKAEEDGRLDEVRRLAEEDTEGTLPTLKLFQSGGVMHEELMELLLAWSVYEKDVPRYPRGLAYPAALLLVNMPPAEAFVSLVNLVQKSFLHWFYVSDPAEEDAAYRVFDTLLADHMPKVYANFSAQVVRPSLYLRPWLSTLFAAFLPIDTSVRLFDVFLLEGDSFMFRVALVLLQVLEPRLFNPDLAELAAVFSGDDRGAVAVVRREKGLLTPDGGAREELEGVRVEREDVYLEMGASEERVFALLQAMDWKEETWARLIERELPEAV